MYQTITLYTLNLHNVVCKFYLTESGGKRSIPGHLSCFFVKVLSVEHREKSLLKQNHPFMGYKLKTAKK